MAQTAQFADRLCDALEIPKNSVTSVTITATPDDVRVNVELVVLDSTVCDGVATLLREYRLVSKEAADGME